MAQSRNFLQRLFNIMTIIRSKFSLSYNKALCYNSLGSGKRKKFRSGEATDENKNIQTLQFQSRQTSLQCKLQLPSKRLRGKYGFPNVRYAGSRLRG